VKTYGTDLDEPDPDRVVIGVSEYVVAEDGETLVAYGLGACVAIALYDPENDVAGLAHTMLPSKEAGSDGADGKFVDSATHAMLREMIEAGAGYGTVEARLIGGADIFELEDLDREVGSRNAAVAREELADLDVPIVDEAVGDDYGRTAIFDTSTGTVRVETAHSEPELLG
jgi:chemotaxis protein CheD